MKKMNKTERFQLYRKQIKENLNGTMKALAGDEKEIKTMEDKRKDTIQ